MCFLQVKLACCRLSSESASCRVPPESVSSGLLMQLAPFVDAIGESPFSDGTEETVSPALFFPTDGAN